MREENAIPPNGNRTPKRWRSATATLLVLSPARSVHGPRASVEPLRSAFGWAWTESTTPRTARATPPRTPQIQVLRPTARAQAGAQ